MEYLIDRGAPPEGLPERRWQARYNTATGSQSPPSSVSCNTDSCTVATAGTTSTARTAAAALSATARTSTAFARSVE